MKIIIQFILPAVLILSSCSSNVYKNKAFFSQTKLSGQALAILPVEVIYTGNLPRNWTDQHVADLEKEQSFQLQERIYEEFLFNASSREIKKKWPVKLMDLRLINDKLAQKGISIQESWKLPSQELAAILGADMLIRTRVQNVRYMSQAAATGINIGASILEGILNRGGTSVYGPRARAAETDMDVSLYHSSRPEAVARIDRQNKLKIKGLPVYVKN